MSQMQASNTCLASLVTTLLLDKERMVLNMELLKVAFQPPQSGHFRPAHSNWRGGRINDSLKLQNYIILCKHLQLTIYCWSIHTLYYYSVVRLFIITLAKGSVLVPTKPITPEIGPMYFRMCSVSTDILSTCPCQDERHFIAHHSHVIVIVKLAWRYHKLHSTGTYIPSNSSQ